MLQDREYNDEYRCIGIFNLRRISRNTDCSSNSGVYGAVHSGAAIRLYTVAHPGLVCLSSRRNVRPVAVLQSCLRCGISYLGTGFGSLRTKKDYSDLPERAYPNHSWMRLRSYARYALYSAGLPRYDRRRIRTCRPSVSYGICTACRASTSYRCNVHCVLSGWNFRASTRLYYCPEPWLAMVLRAVRSYFYRNRFPSSMYDA